MRPSEFLTLLWGERPPGLIQLWQLDGKRSINLASPSQADYYAAGQTDVYCGVGLAHKDHGPHRRARAHEVVAIAGLWIDIDVDGGPDDKRGGVPSAWVAGQLARAIAEPTIVVSSGYGVHAWHLFDEPWRFATRDEQHAAAAASAQWYALHRARAAEHGWGLDHTHDLARLLRPPHTFNGKGGSQAAVQLLRWGGPRYGRDELLGLAAEAGPVAAELPGAPKAAAVTQIGADSPAEATHATPVTTRLRALIENDETFADTWRNQRVDAPAWSMSEYDLSIATQLAIADWADPDIAIAITLHRRRHDPHDVKAHRRDYLARTVAAARESAARGNAAEQLRLLADEGRAAA